MALYSKSISDIIATTMNKKAAKLACGGVAKKEKVVKEKKEKKVVPALVLGEDGPNAGKIRKPRAPRKKKVVEEVLAGVVPEREESVGGGETVTEDTVMEPVVEEYVEAVEVVEPIEKVAKVTKTKSFKKEKKVRVAKIAGPPKWFMEYAKGMETAHGVTDNEKIKEVATSKWQEEGMPKRAENERNHHVRRMYSMMFQNK
jgi:hypothetical protein